MPQISGIGTGGDAIDLGVDQFAGQAKKACRSKSGHKRL